MRLRAGRGSGASSTTCGSMPPRPEAREAISAIMGRSSAILGCRRSVGPPLAMAAAITPSAPKTGAEIAADSGNISPMLIEICVLRTRSSSSRKPFCVQIVRASSELGETQAVLWRLRQCVEQSQQTHQGAGAGHFARDDGRRSIPGHNTQPIRCQCSYISTAFAYVSTKMGLKRVPRHRYSIPPSIRPRDEFARANGRNSSRAPRAGT
jgi:hypothetical protein